MTVTNKLTIYLIKDRFKDKNKVIKKFGKKISIKGIGTFYTEPSHTKQPSWLDRFFKGKLGDISLFVASARGILLTKIKYKQKNIYFAVSFGSGHHMLKQEAIEEGFGLKVTLNSVAENSIRSIEKSNIGANSKISKEQMTISTSATEFGIDIEQDLIRAVTGKSKHEQLGKTISGADALSVSVKVDIDNVIEFLSFCYGRYLSKDYLKDFDWIDQIHHIKNPLLIRNLEKIILQRFNKKEFETLWMVVPDLLDWTELKGFKFLPRQEELSDDLDIHIFRDTVGLLDELDKIVNQPVRAMSAVRDEEMAHWSAYKCLYGEVKYRSKQYLLNNGKWYEINKEFVTIVNNTYKRIPLSDIDLLDYDHGNEGEYNEALADSNPDFLLLDKKMIQHGGGKNKIEFCDIYSKHKKIIHIKHYGASAVLSHLFMQGMNSGEYLNSDSDFRRKLNNMLDPGWKFKSPDTRINPEAYEIIFAIISRDASERPAIPFFSKVSIKNVARRLKGYRYKVSLKKITSLKN